MDLTRIFNVFTRHPLKAAAAVLGAVSTVACILALNAPGAFASAKVTAWNIASLAAAATATTLWTGVLLNESKNGQRMPTNGSS